MAQGRQPEAVDDLLDIRELHDQLFRHAGAVGLVFGKLAVPLGGTLAVEDQGQVVGLALLDHLEEHVGDAVGGVGGQALGSAEPPDGMEGPVKIGTDVDEIEYPGCVGHGRPPVHL